MIALRRWARRHHIYTGRINRVRYYPERHDLPEVPPANTLAVAGTRERPKWILMDCPCGHGHTNLLPAGRSPGSTWLLSAASAGPSLSPSIDRRAETRCHYWLRDGRVEWAHE